ncbi:MAG: hypothetical protein OXU51_07985 [Candidatus Poribacteria bacterium]|nr:hypothetical protein [Candidatus Poribacteria bacterium]
MKTVFKFAFFILLGISAVGFVATAFLYIFNPNKTELVEEPEQVALVSDAANEVSAPIETSDQGGEQPAPIETITAPELEASSEQIEEVTTPESEASSEQAPADTEEDAEAPSLSDAKQISWDLTPAEQELEVGDWISIEGYQDDLIGATVAEHAATRVLKWNDSSALYETNGMVDIVSQATGLPAPDDRIVSVVGLVENPREDETVVQINKALLREQTVLIRATGQIDHISGDKSPKRWIVFLKKGVYVDFTGHQNGSQ